jgi:hypothetical protein
MPIIPATLEVEAEDQEFKANQDKVSETVLKTQIQKEGIGWGSSSRPLDYHAQGPRSNTQYSMHK